MQTFIGNRIALAADTMRHRIEIKGLSAGEQHHVAVGVQDTTGIYYPPQFFDAVWDPIQSEKLSEDIWPVMFAVFGDSGFGDSITYQLAE